MVNLKAMKSGINLMTSLGWMCVFIGAFVLLGSEASAADDGFRKIALMLMAAGFYTLAPGTMIALVGILMALFKQRRDTK